MRRWRKPLFWLAVIAGFFSFGQFRMLLPGNEAPAQAVTAQQRAVMQTLEQARQAMKEERFLQALTLLQDVQGLLRETPTLEVAYGARVAMLEGDAHWQLWQYTEAYDAYAWAMQQAGPSLQARLREQMTRLESVIEQANRERDQESVYRASPYVGPAFALKGRVVVAYVFVSDKGAGSWGVRQRDFALRAWQRAERWLQQAAAGYGESLTFNQRVFIVDRAPQIKRLQVGSGEGQLKHAAQVAHLVAEQLGEKNMIAFLSRLKREEQADQAALIMHLDRDERSFATRCMGGCSSSGEYVFLFESATAKKWQSMEYAQAHETLHLFGADDLYQIKGAKYFATRDIMNYVPRVLRASELGAVSAYGVGLLDEKPEAPFEIVDSRQHKKRY